MAAPEFCSGFSGSVNVYLTLYKETGGIRKSKGRDRWSDGQRRKEVGPLVRGKRKGGREGRQAQGGACSDKNKEDVEAGTSIPYMNLSRLGYNKYQQTHLNS